MVWRMEAMNRDERRGRDANLGGRPFNTSENIDWQRGWQNAEDDRGLDLDDLDDLDHEAWKAAQ